MINKELVILQKYIGPLTDEDYSKILKTKIDNEDKNNFFIIIPIFNNLLAAEKSLDTNQIYKNLRCLVCQGSLFQILILILHKQLN